MSLKRVALLGLTCFLMLAMSGIVSAMEYKEAPMLAEQVKAGTLPPVEERLPKVPYVEEVVDSIGQYGGTMRRTWRGRSDRWGVAKLGEEWLTKFSKDGSEILPNVAESYEILDNSTRYVFHMREGMKWSDGEPFDADDCVFYWEHVVLTEATGNPPGAFYYVNGELPKVEKIDQYTFQMVFSAPYPMFLFSTPHILTFFVPEHYARTILPEFIGQEAAEKLAQEQGFADARTMVNEKLGYHWIYPDVPTIRPWVPVNDLSEPRWVMRRNPYYFKVDPEGNQLPYIDEVVHQQIENNDILPMKVLAGEVDMQGRGVRATDYSLYMENHEKGGYNVVRWRDVTGSGRTLKLNQTVKDPVLRELFEDVRFRQAISVALDREEINEIAYDGMRLPRQASIPPGGMYYSEEWEKSYAQYDPDLSEQLLDEMGLEWDAEGNYRLRPDGEVLEVLINARSGQDVTDLELCVKYLEDIGIKAVLKLVDRSLYEEMAANNDLVVGTWGTSGFNFLIAPRDFVPLRTAGNGWYGDYSKYNETQGKEGEKPEGDMALLVEYWNKVITAQTKEERDEYGRKIVDLHIKNLWIVGIAGGAPRTYIVNKNLGNIPSDAGLVIADILRDVGNAKPWQFYFKQ